MAFLAGKGFVILNRKAEQGDQKAKDLLSKLNSIDQDEADRLFSEILGKSGGGSSKEKKIKAPGASATDGQGKITEGAGEQPPTGKTTPKGKDYQLEIDDLTDKLSEVRQGRMDGDVNKIRARIKELEGKKKAQGKAEPEVAAPAEPTGKVEPKTNEQSYQEALAKVAAEKNPRKKEIAKNKLITGHDKKIDQIEKDLESFNAPAEPTGEVKPKAEAPAGQAEPKTRQELQKTLNDFGIPTNEYVTKAAELDKAGIKDDKQFISEMLKLTENKEPLKRGGKNAKAFVEKFTQDKPYFQDEYQQEEIGTAYELLNGDERLTEAAAQAGAQFQVSPSFIKDNKLVVPYGDGDFEYAEGDYYTQDQKNRLNIIDLDKFAKAQGIGGGSAAGNKPANQQKDLIAQYDDRGLDFLDELGDDFDPETKRRVANEYLQELQDQGQEFQGDTFDRENVYDRLLKTGNKTGNTNKQKPVDPLGADAFNAGYNDMLQQLASSYGQKKKPEDDPLSNNNLKNTFDEYEGDVDSVLDYLRTQNIGMTNGEIQEVVEGFATGYKYNPKEATEKIKKGVGQFIQGNIQSDIEPDFQSIADEFGITPQEVQDVYNQEIKAGGQGTTIDTAGANVQPAGATGDIEPETQQLAGIGKKRQDVALDKVEELSRQGKSEDEIIEVLAQKFQMNPYESRAKIDQYNRGTFTPSEKTIQEVGEMEDIPAPAEDRERFLADLKSVGGLDQWDLTAKEAAVRYGLTENEVLQIEKEYVDEMVRQDEENKRLGRNLTFTSDSNIPKFVELAERSKTTPITNEDVERLMKQTGGSQQEVTQALDRQFGANFASDVQIYQPDSGLQKVYADPREQIDDIMQSGRGGVSEQEADAIAAEFGISKDEVRQLERQSQSEIAFPAPDGTPIPADQDFDAEGNPTLTPDEIDRQEFEAIESATTKIDQLKQQGRISNEEAEQVAREFRIPVADVLDIIGDQSNVNDQEVADELGVDQEQLGGLLGPTNTSTPDEPVDPANIQRVLNSVGGDKAKALQIIKGQQATQGGLQINDKTIKQVINQVAAGETNPSLPASEPTAEQLAETDSLFENTPEKEMIASLNQAEQPQDLEQAGAQGFKELLTEIDFNPTIITDDQIKQVAQKLQLDGKTPDQLADIRDGVVKAWAESPDRRYNDKSRAAMSAITAAIDSYSSGRQPVWKVNQNYQQNQNQAGSKPAQAPAQIKQTAQANAQAAGVEKPQQSAAKPDRKKVEAAAVELGINADLLEGLLELIKRIK